MDDDWKLPIETLLRQLEFEGVPRMEWFKARYYTNAKRWNEFVEAVKRIDAKPRPKENENLLQLITNALKREMKRKGWVGRGTILIREDLREAFYRLCIINFRPHALPDRRLMDDEKYYEFIKKRSRKNIAFLQALKGGDYTFYGRQVGFKKMKIPVKVVDEFERPKRRTIILPKQNVSFSRKGKRRSRK